MLTTNSVLTEEQRTHFLEHGWLHVPGAVPPENLQRYVGDVWIRSGYDPKDTSTWEEEKILMPRQKEMDWKSFSPKGWAAICEVIGGEEKIDTTVFCKATDGFIANYGKEEYRDKHIEPKDLGNWHVDGNWFTHFLDSSDHSVLCVVLFSDVGHRGGGTYISEDGLTDVVHWLHDRPEGCHPKLIEPDGTTFFDNVPKWKNFVEITGKAGDLFICHGFMPHSASKNHLRTPRFITSPRFVLKEPFNYNRENPEDYSLIEQKTLRELGVSSLPNWRSTGTRSRFTPLNKAKKDAQVMKEVERLKRYAEKTGGIVDSIHINGMAEYHGYKEKTAPQSMAV